ncbi:MAG: 13E12 repeat family protein, partial [Pseudonocardia sp.]|nr:13E12 repeat family protein [Pseudonocardia sp.]
MSTGPLTSTHRHLGAALDELSAAAVHACPDELLSVLTMCEGAARRLDQITVVAVATLERSGTFVERGYSSTAAALGDLLGWERFEARRRVTAAEQVCPRLGLDGTPRPARLAATAAVFAAGQASLRHVETIARVLGTAAAQRLTPEIWAGAETQLAAKTAEYTPTELHTWGTALVEALDQDGAEPDDRPPAQVNELHLSRHRNGGGRIKGRFDDAAMYDAIATVIDAHARPVTGEDERT